MKMFVEPANIYLYIDIVDFRKSINGLIVVVEQDMNLNPFRDALFVFCNKKRDKVIILYWDKTGFALWYKRLEKHQFKWTVLIPSVSLGNHTNSALVWDHRSLTY